MSRKIFVAGAALVLSGGMFVPVALAATFAGGNTYALPQGETIAGNFYAGGGTVVIAGNVQGDLGVAGGTVFVTGAVVQDALVVGGNVNISGPIGGDLRILGGNVTVNDSVSGEILVLGGKVNIGQNARVGSMTVVGGQIVYEGISSGPSQLIGENVDVNGSVAGDLWAKAKQLVIGNGAKVEGALTYQAPQAALISNGAEISGAVTFEPQPEPASVFGMNREDAKMFVFSILSAWWLTKLVMGIIMALAFFFLFPAGVTALVRETLRGWKKDLLYGFLALVVTPVVVVGLLLTVVGAPLGLLVLLVFLTHLILAGLGAGIFLGSIAIKYVAKKDVHPVTWQSIVLGVGLLAIIGLVPIIGWVFAFIFFLIALGGLMRHTAKVLALGR
ncbi:MAG TPA: hypothetical protein VMC43_03925 [Candidatus Paceibacterota bacterium]|nr:hypothetical protein [Candidatus Paceibacterota bacterium]